MTIGVPPDTVVYEGGGTSSTEATTRPPGGVAIPSPDPFPYDPEPRVAVPVSKKFKLRRPSNHVEVENVDSYQGLLTSKGAWPRRFESC